MKTLKYFPLILVFGGFCQVVAGQSMAAFSTLDSSGGYAFGGGTTVGGADQGYRALASQFTATNSGILRSIDMGLNYFNAPDQVDVRLALSTGNLPPPTSVFSDTVTTVGAFAGTSTDLTTLSASGSVMITAGTTYWLILSPDSNSTYDSWEFSDLGGFGRIALSGDDVNWGQNPSSSMYAFQVNVSPVPEPSVLTLGVASLAALALIRLRPKAPRAG